MKNHDNAVRVALKKVQMSMDQNPESFRPAQSSRIGLWLWRIAVVLLTLGCIAVWFVLPALQAGRYP